MVDIDGEVVDFCKEHLPQNAAAFADPRLELIIDDAKKVLEESTELFDVIIMDLDDPMIGGPCYQLYTQEFYAMCKSKLSPSGVFVTQSGCAGLKNHPKIFAPLHHTLRQVFAEVRPYKQCIYSFCDEWGFNVAFNDPAAAAATLGLGDAAAVDAAIEGRVSGGAAALRHLEGAVWAALWVMSKTHRKTLAAEQTVWKAADRLELGLEPPQEGQEGKGGDA
jgi:thermospermine synthase